MAKKRKDKGEEEQLDFKAPKFDEEKFIKKERRNIKTLFISFGLGFLLSLICFGFWSFQEAGDIRWFSVLLVCVASASFLKYLFLRLDIDLTDFGKKGWFSSYAVYFFTWLIIFIILVNPPFYDDESPHVEVVTLPDMQEPGGTVNIVAMIADNVGVEKEGIEFTLTYPDETSYTPEFTFEDSIFTFTYENSDNILGEYAFTLMATDVNGHDSESQTGTFTYSNDTIKLPEPIAANELPGAEVTYTTSIKFDVKADVSRFYYKINDGDEINVTKSGDYYVTSPKIEGWTRNTNVTIKAFAEVIYYFENSPIQYNNTLVDNGIYYFNVSDVPEIGGEDPPTVTMPQYIPIQVPGFELVVFIISLIAVVLIFKYRKKDRRN